MPRSASYSGATKLGSPPLSTRPSTIDACELRCATIRAPSGASARQSAWLPWVAPFVRNHERAAPNASAASCSARSYGVGDGPRSMPWMSCGTSAASAVEADRLAHAGVGSLAALVAGHVVAARPAERVRDDASRYGAVGWSLAYPPGSVAIARRILCACGGAPVVAFAGMDAEILAAVAAEEAAMADLLAELVEAPTLLGDEAAGQAIMRRAFAELGLEPFDVPIDPAALDGHPGAAPFGWDVAGKANVLANWEPAAGRRRPLADPQRAHRRRQPRAGLALERAAVLRAARRRLGLGRGAGDMKSGLAAIVGAVRGLRRLGLAPRGRVQLQSVVEEECTGNGALACVLAGHTADAAILTEPTRGAIWNAQVGVLWFQVHVAGLPAHAGDAPVGANAIEASFRAIEALRALEAELNAVKPPLYAAYPHPINLNVGVIRGGDWPSTVAGECVTHFRLALYPGERVEDAEGARRGRGGRLPRRAATASRSSTRASRARATSWPPDAPLVAGPARRRRAHDRRPRRRCTRRPRRPTRAASSSTATRRRSASAPSPSTSTASTSASTCHR